MFHYGPVSYYTLGRIFPREKLRLEPQRAGRARRFYLQSRIPALVMTCQASQASAVGIASVGQISTGGPVAYQVSAVGLPVAGQTSPG